MIFLSVIVTQVYSSSSDESVSCTESDGFMWVARNDILSIIVEHICSLSPDALGPSAKAGAFMWVDLNDNFYQSLLHKSTAYPSHEQIHPREFFLKISRPPMSHTPAAYPPMHPYPAPCRCPS